MTLITLLSFITFLIGLYFYIKYSDPKSLESLENNKTPRCPNILIQKGCKFYLYNSKVSKVPGVNPIEFSNLEDYVEFLDWQRSRGIRCPVLYVQQTYDAQGNPVYKVRPSVTEPQSGLPPSIATSIGNIIHEDSVNTNIAVPPNPTLLVDATRNDKPYNMNSYPSFDQTSYYVGTTTPLDDMNTQNENMLFSPNPMDPNWGGADYTDKLIKQGYYKDNEVSIRVP